MIATIQSTCFFLYKGLLICFDESFFKNVRFILSMKKIVLKKIKVLNKQIK